MTSELSGKTVIVTGAGRGLGRAFADRAARDGASVLVNDIDMEEAEAVAQAIREAGGDALASGHDVSDPAQARAMAQAAVNRWGGLSGLVNNAAVHHLAPIWAEDPERVARLVKVNLLGAIYVTMAAMPHMRAAGSGSIVNMTSSALQGLQQRGSYAATKGALLSLTYCWALELGEHGIRVNAIAPRAMTRMTHSTAGDLGSVDDIAPVCSYLLSDLALGITGQCLRADGRQVGWMLPTQHGQMSSRGSNEILAVAHAVASLEAAPPVGFRALVEAPKA